MHFILHLTNDCNLACDYCYVCQKKEYMESGTIRSAALLAARQGQKTVGIGFFGGEPMMCRDRISETVEYCRTLEREYSMRFHFKMTTNGTLLDRQFLEYAARERIMIALSCDGTQKAHDRHRKYKSGAPTWEQLNRVIPDLLELHPYSPVMMTVTPETVQWYAQGVQELWEKGFHYFICSLDYSGDWSDRTVRILAGQYRILAKWYEKLTYREEKFYFSPFEMKIASHIRGENYCHERCELGRRQVSVAPDGRIYPCTQFVGKEEFCIGDVRKGIDEQRRLALFLTNEQTKPECSGCAVLERCNCHCGCLNYQVTGSIQSIPAILCEHERILFPVVDRMAERLYKDRNGMFIQKHYNQIFPLISLVEDLKR